MKIKKIDYHLIKQYKSISIVFFAKVLYASLSLLIVPVLINQLSSYEYGLFTTIVTATTWFSLFDGGLSNGLKNKLSEAFANKDMIEARKIVSTSYILVCSVSIFFISILLTLYFTFDWNVIFHVIDKKKADVNMLFTLGSSMFLLRMVLDLINVVLQCHQRAGFAALMQTLSQVFVCMWIYGLKYYFNSTNLILYAAGYFIIPVIIMIALNFFFFNTLFKSISPSINYFDSEKQKELLKIGGMFFVIQIAGIIIFTTDSLIVSRLFDYAEVAKYNIAYRYFGILTFINSIVLIPYWPAFTEAYVKKDFVLIKKNISTLRILWLGIVIVSIVMLFVSNYVYSIWIGETFTVKLQLNLGMCLFIIISCWNNVYTIFLNAIGKLKLQFYSAIFIGIINIPLSIFFSKYVFFDSTGVIVGTSICLLVSAVWSPIQYYKIMNQRATGIWNK